jgi:hypothetical protein
MRRVLLVAILFMVATFAGAAVYPQFSLENLVDRSPTIVEGRVTRSFAAWDPDHKYIWTHYELQVSDRLRGGAQTVTVSEPGGRLDGINMMSSGAQPYVNGEHVLLFMFKTPIGYWRTQGGGQGKFTVGVDGRVASGARIMELNGTPAGTNLSSVDRMELSQFKSLVRRMVQTRPTPKEEK